jgi:hypothetical protein
MKELSRFEALELLHNNYGKVFTAEFIKKNGETRKINCRLGVKKDLKGGTNPVKNYLQYLTVYDMQKKGYRNINLGTLMLVKINKVCYTINDGTNNTTNISNSVNS